MIENKTNLNFLVDGSDLFLLLVQQSLGLGQLRLARRVLLLQLGDLLLALDGSFLELKPKLRDVRRLKA